MTVRGIDLSMYTFTTCNYFKDVTVDHSSFPSRLVCDFERYANNATENPKSLLIQILFSVWHSKLSKRMLLL